MSTAAPGFALPRAPSSRRRRREAPGIALRAVDTLNGISQIALLDRLIRSRVWIGLIAFSLIGLVAMQLLVLHLNTQVGRVLAREAALQRENTQLSIAASEDSAGGVVEPAAAAAGMAVAPPGSLHFLTASPANIGAAVAALRTPLQQAPATGEYATSTATTAGEASSSSGAPTGEASSSSGAPTGGASSSSGAPTGESSSSSAASTGEASPGSAETGATSAPAAGG